MKKMKRNETYVQTRIKDLEEIFFVFPHIQFFTAFTVTDCFDGVFNCVATRKSKICCSSGAVSV